MSTAALPVIDVHAHLAGLGQGGTGCAISPRKFRSPLYTLMRWKLGLLGAHRRGTLDQEYRARLEREVSAAAEHGALDAAVIFAHDRVYDDSGACRDAAQEVYVPNEYAFSCAENPAVRGRFLPAMSVHPYRQDALDETARWIERGAVAMKWLPNSQGMDPRDPRCAAIYSLLASHRVPLIAHTGGEHTVRMLRRELSDPEVLRPALDAGVTVIMAHCGTNSGLFDPNGFPSFCRLVRDCPNAYGDISAFNTPGRVRWFARILREEGLLEKLVHGSDYPVPPTAWWSLGVLSLSEIRRCQRVWGFLERDVLIKRARGVPDAVFRNAARILRPGCLERWGVTRGNAKNG
jgi:predicted TIM-barrel fold metal-dependent hydrolase